MPHFVINGQKRLSGDFHPVGNKNAALPMLAAALLTDEPVTLHNVPQINDVAVMLELLGQLGVDVKRSGSSVTLKAGSVKRRKLDPDLCRKVRSSILIAGPLAAAHGRAVVHPPGGDVIGRRRLDTHFQGLRALGIEIEGGDVFTFRRKTLRGADLWLDEASVTATENIIMAASLADGTTTIFNAACEPHVQDLCRLLVRMGAAIEGIGTNRLRIEGSKSLHGAEMTVGPDYIELGSYIAAAAATGGELRITGVTDAGAYWPVIERGLHKLGVRFAWEDDVLRSSTPKTLRVLKDVGSAIPKIEDGLWPAFPSDLMSVAIVLATQSRGSVLFFEKMFESRMYFVDRLIEMGAHVIQCDPHRVVVQGPTRLNGIHMSSPDIRAGMAMVIAALCARGESVIDNAQMIDRGYERIDDRLRALGADIERDD